MVSFCIAIVITACVPGLTGKETDIAVQMERTECFGKCPVYTITIGSDGKVTFEGKQFTNVTGKAEARLEREKIDELIAEVIKADFYSLNSSYFDESDGCPSTATDSPTVNLTITLGSYEKSVRHYHGCMEKRDGQYRTYPAGLTNLEERIDEIAGTNRWIAGSK